MKLNYSFFKRALLLSLLFLQFVKIEAQTKPNIIVVFADDISARELPIYGSDTWSSPMSKSTSDRKYRAKTPVLDMMANKGCYIETAWAATICSPSRAMMMTGRYAHLHKWWGNATIGRYTDPADNKTKSIPLFVSSPLTIAHVAKKGGYSSIWAGKTQMRTPDLDKFGFDQGVFTPGESTFLRENPNPFTDFQLQTKKINGVPVLINNNTGNQEMSYAQPSWNFQPHVLLMNHPTATNKLEWWPNTQKSKEAYGLGTYGPDVELDFILDFMERKTKQNKPFFVYHTSHLGHDAFDFLHPESGNKWPGTPKIKWENGKYTRTTPNVKGQKGVFNTNGTITEDGIHRHVNYLDYQMSLYLKKLKELNIENNTVVIFCADNGTSGFGKASTQSQKGTHVPFIIYAPGLGITKKGKQDVLLDMSDVLPTIAEIAGVDIPCDYKINGKSFWPFLTTNKVNHKNFVYAYNAGEQIIRNQKVMIDGKGRVYDVRQNPSDLTSFKVLATTTTKVLTSDFETNKNQLLAISSGFDKFATARNGLPNASVNRMTCSNTPVSNGGMTVGFNTEVNTIDANTLRLPVPIKFTVHNIPNNSKGLVNIRLFRQGVNITQGDYTAQSIAQFDINSNTADVNNVNIKVVTRKNTPKVGFSTRTFVIKKVVLKNTTSAFKNGQNYIVAAKFVNGGTTGTTPLKFSTASGVQKRGGSEKHAVFKLNTLVAKNTLDNSTVANISDRIYVDPFTEKVYVEGADTKIYKIVNTYGQVIKKATETGELSTSDLASGIYFLVTNKGVSRFVKQ